MLLMPLGSRKRRNFEPTPTQEGRPHDGLLPQVLVPQLNAGLHLHELDYAAPAPAVFCSVQHVIASALRPGDMRSDSPTAYRLRFGFRTRHYGTLVGRALVSFSMSLSEKKCITENVFHSRDAGSLLRLRILHNVFHQWVHGLEPRTVHGVDLDEPTRVYDAQLVRMTIDRRDQCPAAAS